MAIKKDKLYKYYTSATFINKDGSESSYITQLYEYIGVYIIWNSDPKLQGSRTPAQMQSLCKHIAKDTNIKDLVWGLEITVKDTNEGFIKI